MPTPLPERKLLRHQGYDYRRSGAYFVTICVEDRLSLFGDAKQDTFAITDAGNMVSEVWRSLPNTFPSVKLDEYVVMPNHMHLIVWLVTAVTPESAVDANDSPASTDKKVNPSLSEIMQWFKSLTTAKYRQGVHTQKWPLFPGKLWQRSYYEHIVRSDETLAAIRSYIQSNPLRWRLDRYHPHPSGDDEEALALWRMLQGESGPS